MIITRHIYRELFSKLIWILGLLILVFTSNRFVSFLADAAEGAIPGDLVFQMLAFKMLATLPKIFPIAILVAMLLSFTRMANDRELVVMLAAGISRRFQLETVLRFAIVFSVLVTVFTLFISPWAERQMQLLSVD
ncbi:MAG: LptF/LptG family permease, partial [Pseudomonadota bacterium]